MLSEQPGNLDVRQNTLEVLVIKVSSEWVAIRAGRLVRLAVYNAAQFTPATAQDHATLPELLGWLAPARLPLFDLAALLGLPVPESEPERETRQIILAEYQQVSVGLRIDAALEIERANLKDIRLLPPVLESMLIKPVVWAIWQRSDEQLISLVDPVAVLDPAAWQTLAEQSGSPG